ncbi:MAG: DUF169 domain-containing protein [Myxococcota bacterium]|nr:DUF169 domain-containing protein [Myxococcota bacterium]
MTPSSNQLGRTVQAPNGQEFARLLQALRLETPVIALYDCDASPAFEPIVHARGRACCFAYYERWCKGESLLIERSDESFAQPKHGCPGLQRALGLGGDYPPWMANFLTDGKNGAPMGEGLKATPQLAQEFLDQATPTQPSGEQLIMGPLRLEQWDKVRSITFFADPDRLAALMTLAAFWSSQPDEIVAPFSSGCGLMWRELQNQGRDRAVLGCTDIAMRKYLPPEIMCITVSPERFARMLDYPEDCFLERSWWRELLDSRAKRNAQTPSATAQPEKH